MAAETLLDFPLFPFFAVLRSLTWEEAQTLARPLGLYDVTDPGLPASTGA